MFKNKFGVVLLTSAVSSLGFAQAPLLNFTSYQLDNFSVIDMNRAGMLVGFDSANRTSIWTPTLGIRNAVQLSGDSYVTKVSDSGTIYGTATGKVIGWNLNSGRNELVNQAGTNFSVLSSTFNDILLIKGTNSGVTKYYTYSSGTGLQQVQSNSSSFTPTMVNFDGTVYGTVPGGTNLVGDPAFLFAKLNVDGTTTTDPRSTQTFYNPQWTQTQTFEFLPNGAARITSRSQTSSGSNTKEDIYGLGGTHYQLSGSSSVFGGSSTTVSDWSRSILADGSSFGMHYNSVAPAFDKMYFSSAHPAGTLVDSSYFAPGSDIPTQFYLGNDMMLLGESSINGHEFYSLSAVPEPGSFAVLGLGVLELARRRRQK